MNTLNWKNECIFIGDATTRALAGNTDVAFNRDIQCFRRYCVMQRDTATREGVHDAAQYIDHCIDDLPEPQS